MALKNTSKSYGSIAKWLHWGTAVLFLASYIAVYYRHWFTEEKTPENWTAIQLHLSIGITIAVIVALRLIWKVTSQSPALEPGTRLEHLAAKLGHYALYVVMIVMPLTGYLGTGVNTEYFFMFDIPKFESTHLYNVFVTEGLGITFKEFEKPLDFVHKNIGGAWLVWLLILGHVTAALYHHFVKKDQTLRKISFGVTDVESTIQQ
jgi:cytochrome b561